MTDYYVSESGEVCKAESTARDGKPMDECEVVGDLRLLSEQNSELRTRLTAHEKAWEAMRADFDQQWLPWSGAERESISRTIDRHKPKGGE